MKIHTPTPYYYRRSTSTFYNITNENSDYAPALAHVFPSERLGNSAELDAQFIVQACNEHYELKECQKKLKDLFNLILAIPPVEAIPGEEYGDTGLDSVAAAQGYNDLLEYLHDHVRKYQRTPTKEGE